MCQAIRDGGRRCPKHRHASIGFIKGVASARKHMNEYQVERLFSELRKEGKTAVIPPEVFDMVRTGFLSAPDNADISDKVKVKVNHQLELSKTHDTDLDSATIYALSTLSRRAKERDEVFGKFLDSIVQQSGLTAEEVKAKFWEEYNSVDTSRNAPQPEEYTQTTRRRAVIANLPYDRASVVAIERLKRLTAPEGEKVRRVTLIDPAVPSSAIKQFGWHNGRLEIVFQHNPDRIYAYRNVSEAEWNSLRFSEAPGRDFRFLNNSEHGYNSIEEAERDGYAMKCVSCGQFRSADQHTCPQLKTRETMLEAGLTTAEINEELKKTHPETETLADTEQEISEEEALQYLREALADEEDEEGLNQLRESLTDEENEEALESLRRALSGETEVEEPSEPEQPAPTARRTATRSTARVTPETLALPDLPDLRSQNHLGEFVKIEPDFTEYPHEAFMSHESLLAQTKREDKDDPIYTALAANNNSNYNPLALEASEGHILVMVDRSNDVDNLNFLNKSDEETVLDFLHESSGNGSYLKPKSVAVLEVKADPNATRYRPTGDVVRIVKMFINEYTTIESPNASAVHNSRWFTKLLITPHEKHFIPAEMTEEKLAEHHTNMNKEIETLLSDESKAVRVDGGASMRVSALNGVRGYTRRQAGSIRSTLPNKAALAAAYKDGKAVVTKFNMSYNYVNAVRDGVIHTHQQSRNGRFSSEVGDGSLHGDIITRMTPEGEVQIVGHSLKCNCWEYRRKYNCAHISLATQDAPKILQAHSKPKPTSMPGLGEAGQTTLRTARSTTYGIGNDPETGKSFLKVSLPRRGNPYNNSVMVDQSPTDNETQITDEATQRMTVLLKKEQNELTDEEKQFIYSYYNKVEQHERRNSYYQPGVRISPLTNRAYLQAVTDSDVEIPVSVSFMGQGGSYYQRHTVSGSVRFGAGSTPEEPKIVKHSLKCSCSEYRRNYRCEHTTQAQKKYLAAYLIEEDTQLTNNPLFTTNMPEETRVAPHPTATIREIYNDLIRDEAQIERYSNNNSITREQAIELIKAEEEQRRVEQAEKLARIAQQAAAYDRYREHRLAAWQTTDTPLADNIEQFKQEVEDVRRRRRRGEKILEPKTENVTDGICAPGEGTRSFGIELEFVIKRGVRKADALRKIGEDLYAAGLTSTPHQQHYHASNGEWNTWSFENDCTVAGEIVSPIMKDTPEHWEQLSKVIEIVKKHGGTVSTKAGSHVNISSGSLAMSTAKHAEITRIMKQNQELMYRLASDPGRGRHRGTQWCHPNLDVATSDIDEKQTGRGRTGTSGTHGAMVNFDASIHKEDLEKARIEYRLWDATLDVAVIQQQVAISAALTDLAEREVIKNKGYKGGRPPVETDPDMKAAKLFDRLFRTTEQRKAALKLFAITGTQNS